MLKTSIKTMGLLMLVALFFTSCSNNEKAEIQPAQTEAMKAFEIESYNVVKRNGDVLTFTTQQEVLDHLQGTDRYEAIKEKFDFLNAERQTILELGLIEKSEDDPAVIDYLKKFEVPTHQRVGPINFCHFDENQRGRTVWTPYSSASIRARNRNQYSSITAIAPQVLCQNRWFGGQHFFFWGTHDTFPWNIDNNSESFY